MPFFIALKEEIVKASLHGKGVYIEMDANSKLGPKEIDGDPHQQSENGKILSRIIKRQSLTVMNNVKNKCKGKITRRRITKKSKEESVIDFVIVNSEIEDIISEVIIDEERKYVLASFRKCKNGVKVKESDHNSIITHLKSSWNKKLNNKAVEIYNFKDENGLKKFRDMTSNGTFLSEVFHSESKSVTVKTKTFMKRLNFVLSQCFRKVRVKQTRQNKKMEELLNKRRILRPKSDEQSMSSLEKVEEELSQMCSEDNYKAIQEACKGLTCEGGT